MYKQDGVRIQVNPLPIGPLASPLTLPPTAVGPIGPSVFKG
jgi:hypothetical protein